MQVPPRSRRVGPNNRTRFEAINAGERLYMPLCSRVSASDWQEETFSVVVDGIQMSASERCRLAFSRCFSIPGFGKRETFHAAARPHVRPCSESPTNNTPHLISQVLALKGTSKIYYQIEMPSSSCQSGAKPTHSAVMTTPRGCS